MLAKLGAMFVLSAALTAGFCVAPTALSQVGCCDCCDAGCACCETGNCVCSDCECTGTCCTEASEGCCK